MTHKKQIRKCLVTGVSTSKRNLIRFIIDPENNLIPDVDQILPGRGYWVKADNRIISKAIDKNILVKAIKEKVTIDTNMIKLIELQFKKKLMQQISLSRKAGQAIFGFEIRNDTRNPGPTQGIRNE